MHKRSATATLVSSVDKGFPMVAATPSLWHRPLRLLACAALAAATAGLAGCGDSSSGKADSRAIYTSQNAAGLMVSAGDYRPATPFPVAIHSTLSSTELRSAQLRAKQNPKSYLAPRSVMRDLRHASAMLATAIGQSGLRHNFKSLLEGQKGQVELLEAQHRINRLSAALAELTSRLNLISQDSALLNSDRLKIADLRTQYKAYAIMHKAALRTALQARRAAERHLAAAEKRVAAAKKLVAANVALRDRFSAAGMALVAESHNTTGTQSLDQYKQAMAKLNQMAKYAAKVEILKSRLSQDMDRANLASMQADAAIRHARELAAARHVAAHVAASALQRMAAIQAGAKAIISGSAAHSGVPTVMDQYAAVTSQLKVALHQADAALTLCNESRQDLKQAAFEQSKNSTYASQLAAHGLRPNDPLILANENRSLQSLYNIQAAAASITAATVSQLKLQVLQLQALCASTGDSIFPLINQQSPVAAPTAAQMQACTTAATGALNHATMDVGQALASGPSGRSPVKWLAPAINFQANIALAEVTADPALKTKYLQVAAQEAQKANQLNPLLNLTVSAK